MNAVSEYQTLLDVFKRLNKLDHAVTILGWDQLVMMPNGGVSARSETLAELSVMRHELISSQSVADALSACENDAENDSESLTVEERRSVAAMKTAYQDVSCLPADLVKRQVIAGSKCEHGWRTQRGKNDWTGFLANFREVVSLAREEASIRQSAMGAVTPYDALLDLHCRGDSSELIDRVFGELKAELPAMIEQVIEQQNQQSSAGASPNKSHSNAKVAHYPVAEQTQLSHALMSSLGFDFNAGRLDVSAHPFSTGVRGDQRITTRYEETTFLDALLATAHETGHASYEAGLPVEWAGLPIGESRNMCIHESQSLMFEKMVTLSDPFLKHLHQLIAKHLSAGKEISFSALLQSARKVSKSFNRVEADELTYPIHVALRYDIERDLINGAIEPEHIPDAWDAAMNAGLGLSTKNNFTDGCLQDIHWTDGTFGYFPSYTLGAVNSAQLFRSLCEANQDWKAQLVVGDVGFVREWLHQNIWQHGCQLTSQQLMERATGEGTNAQSLLAHLRGRYLHSD